MRSSTDQIVPFAQPNSVLRHRFLLTLAITFTWVWSAVSQNLPTVALSTTTNTVPEGDGSQITITATLSAAQEQNNIFGITLTGSGVVAEDFVNPPQNIEVVAGMTTGSVTVTLADDSIIEGTESVTASINNVPPSVTLANPSATTFTITDNDFATIGLSATDTIQTEAQPTRQFQVTIDTNGREMKKDLVVNLSLAGGQSAIGAFGGSGDARIPHQDFRISPNQVTFSAGNADGDSRTIEVEYFTDNLIEGEETSSVSFSSSSEVAAPNLSASHTLKIQDSNTPSFSFTTVETVFQEVGVAKTFSIRLDIGNNQLLVPLNFELNPGEGDVAKGNFPSNGNNPFDYQISPTSLNFPAGSGDQSLLNVQVQGKTDTLVEGVERGNIALSLTSTGFPGFNPPTAHQIKVEDSNQAKVEYEFSSTSVSEGDAASNINVVLDTDGATLAVPIRVTLTNASSGAANPSLGPADLSNLNATPPPTNTPDFEVSQPIADFSVGDGDATVKSLSATPVADNLVEGSESATLGLSVTSGPAGIGARNQFTYNIADGDSATVAFDSTGAVMAEGQANQGIAIKLSTGGAFLAVPVSVTVNADNTSTAIFRSDPPVANADYSITNTTPSFPTSSGDQTLIQAVATTLSDQLLEGEEAADLSIQQTSGPATIGNQNTFRLRITDTNSGTVSFANATSSANEQTAGRHPVTVQIDTGGATLERPLSIPFIVNNRSAVGGSDFQPPDGSTITWPANTGNGATQTIAVDILNDTLLEPSEDFDIGLRSPAAGSPLVSSGTHVVTIVDDDQATVGLSVVRATGTEGGDAAEVAMVLSLPSSTDTVLAINLSGTANPAGSVQRFTLQAGRTQQIISLAVVDDDLVEAQETLTTRIVSIESGDEQIRINTEGDSATVTINDNDSSHITLVNQQNAAEDQQDAELKINLSKAIHQSIQLDLSFAGTATRNSDYAAPNLRLTVPARQTSLVVQLQVVADNLDESDETILASVAGNNLPNLPITVQEEATQILILDNDDTPVGVADGGARYTIDEDQTLNVSRANGVLANDTDGDDGNGPDHLTASLEGNPPTNAQTFTLNNDGSFTYLPNANFHGADSFQYRASDGTNQSPPILVNLTVNSVNDAPVFSIPGPQTVLEGSNLVFDGPRSISVQDIDLGENNIEVSLSATGLLTLGSQAGIRISRGTGSNDTQVTFDGNIGAVNQALSGLIYTHPTGPSSDTISLVATDGANPEIEDARTTNASIPITIRPLNSPPQLTLPETVALSVTGTGASQIVSPSLSVVDSDGGNLATATVLISQNFVPGEDSLTATVAPAGIRTTFDSNSGRLTLQGPAPIPSFQNALRSVAFSNSSSTPNTTTRTVTFSVSDGTAQSNSVGRDVTVAAPAFPPSISSLSTGRRTFREGGLPVALIGSPSVSQGSAGRLLRATASISQGFVAGEDVLNANLSSAITSKTFSNGTLTLNGQGSSQDFSRILGSFTYHNTSSNPTPGIRTISIDVSDAERSSNSLTVSVEVIAVNDSPSINLGSTTLFEFKQGSSPITVFGSVSLSDPDDGQLGAATLMLSRGFSTTADQLDTPTLPTGLNSTGFDRQTGSLTIEGVASIADYESAIRSVQFRNDSEFTDDRTLTVSLAVADPDGASSNTVNQQLSLIGRSTPPEIIGLEDVTFPEDTKAFRIPFTVKDDRTPVDKLQITFDFEAPETLFSPENIRLVQEGSALRFDLEPLPNGFGEAVVTLKVTDSVALTTTQTFKILVEGENDVPLLEVSPLDPLTFVDGSGPRIFFDEVILKDTDNKELFSAVLKFTTGYQPHQDLLIVEPRGAIQANYDSAKGEMVLTGKGTVEDYATTLQTLQYQNLSHQPTEGNRAVNLTVFDTAKTNGKPIDLEIQVFDANLPPEPGADHVVADAGDSLKITVLDLLKNDTDPDGDPISVSLVTRRTQLGHPVLFDGDTITIPRPDPSATDRFHYTITDQRGGLASIPVLVSP